MNFTNFTNFYKLYKLFKLYELTIKMKKILFIRHGKAEDQNTDITDFERSLTTKGKKELHTVAARLQEKQASIGLFYYKALLSGLLRQHL